MNSKTLIAGALGAVAVAGGALFAVTGQDTDKPDAAPTDRRAPVTAQTATAPTPAATTVQRHAVVPAAGGLITHEDPAPFFHRPPEHEVVCNGVRGTVDADGVGHTVEDCRRVNRNRSPYSSYSNEALMADIDAGQPWATDMMEELGTRYLAHGYAHTGVGWLKEAAARTGKVGLLHVAGLQYIHGDVENEVLRYELIGILVARGYPAYEPKMLLNQRVSLVNAGVDPARLDALDAEVAEFVANMPPMDSDASGDGGAS